MRDFCEIISVDRKDLFFAFTPFYGNEHPHYSVTVALSGSSSIRFEMEKSDCGSWHFNGDAPKWIERLHSELAHAITSNC